MKSRARRNLSAAEHSALKTTGARCATGALACATLSWTAPCDSVGACGCHCCHSSSLRGMRPWAPDGRCAGALRVMPRWTSRVTSMAAVPMRSNVRAVVAADEVQLRCGPPALPASKHAGAPLVCLCSKTAPSPDSTGAAPPQSRMATSAAAAVSTDAAVSAGWCSAAAAAAASSSAARDAASRQVAVDDAAAADGVASTERSAADGVASTDVSAADDVASADSADVTSADVASAASSNNAPADVASADIASASSSTDAASNDADVASVSSIDTSSSSA
mmetsp:Transcript_18876/g.63802  ORF Transcript_18876/g.63802 Transcript_18876/m.63802 type:complete len:279 (+) Transcript_18876:77-913(+)